LTDEQVSKIAGIYKGMFDEINSEYQHKYDLLRNLVFELLHFAMKLPSVKFSKQPVNASQSTTKLAHLQENMGSADFEFTPEELKNITDAISKIKIVGDRYPVRQTN